MALIKLGALITGISGTIGGQTFGQGSSGNYIRNTGKSSSQTSPKRSLSLFNMSFVAQRWRTLSLANKETWVNAAVNFPYINRLGEVKYYSGYLLFTKFNGNLKYLGETLIDVAPAPYSFTEIVDLDVSYIPSSIIVSATSVDVNSLYSLFLSPPTSAGVTSPYQNQKLIANIPAASVTGPLDVTAEVVAALGSIIEGATYWWRFKVTHDVRGISMDSFFTGSFIVA